MRGRRPQASLKPVAPVFIMVFFWGLVFSGSAHGWKFLPEEGLFVYPRIDGVGFLTKEVPQGIGRVVSALAEKGVAIGEGEIVYVNVGASQGLKKGDRLIAFSLYKPRELKGMRVVVVEARLLLTEVKENESEAVVEDSYRSVSIGSRVERYQPAQTSIRLKPAPADLTGRIIWSYENLVSFGEGDVVFLDKGKIHGIEPGQCYQIFRAPVKDWKLETGSRKAPPPGADDITRGIGELLILRSEEDTSAALVRKSQLPLEIGDRFRAGCTWEDRFKVAKAQVQPSQATDDLFQMQKEEFENKDVLFPYDSYVLTPEARRLLKEKAEFLSRYPQTTVLIEGHCDERGTREYNLALGDRRAQAAKKYLLGLGITPERIRTISYGKENPVDPGHNEAAWARNRRAHFVIEKE